MQVDIYLREKNGSREIRFPLLPEKITYKSGDTEFATYEIMNRGEVAVPTGVGLSRIGWEADFPGEGRQNDPAIRGTWQAPKNFHDTLEDWKSKGTLLTIIVTGYPFNFDVDISTYEAELSGPFGDMQYTLELQEHRDITIKTEQVKTSSTTTKRTTTQATTHTIKSGDTLWSIAEQKTGSGSNWTQIYNANKDIIETTAKKKGKSSSNNGWLIYPGVTLTIPNANRGSINAVAKG